MVTAKWGHRFGPHCLSIRLSDDPTLLEGSEFGPATLAIPLGRQIHPAALLALERALLLGVRLVIGLSGRRRVRRHRRAARRVARDHRLVLGSAGAARRGRRTLLVLRDGFEEGQLVHGRLLLEPRLARRLRPRLRRGAPPRLLPRRPRPRLRLPQPGHPLPPPPVP